MRLIAVLQIEYYSHDPRFVGFGHMFDNPEPGGSTDPVWQYGFVFEMPEPFQAGTPDPRWFDCLDDENIDRHHRREDWMTR